MVRVTIQENGRTVIGDDGKIYPIKNVTNNLLENQSVNFGSWSATIVSGEEYDAIINNNGEAELQIDDPNLELGFIDMKAT